MMKRINLIYIIFFCTMFVTKILADEWYSAPPLIVARGGATAVTYQNNIYVFGGKSFNNKVLNSVEKYNIFESVWDTSSVPPFKYPRYNAAAVVFEERIYLIGGHDGESVLKSVEMYDPVHNSWSEVHSLRRDREALAGTVFNNRIYAIGGQKDVQTLVDEIEWYDEPVDNWQEAIFDLPFPRAAHFYHTSNDTFYMFGGYYYGLTRTAYKAVPGLDGYSWIQLDNLSQSRAYGATVRIKDEIYLRDNREQEY